MVWTRIDRLQQTALQLIAWICFKDFAVKITYLKGHHILGLFRGQSVIGRLKRKPLLGPKTSNLIVEGLKIGFQNYHIGYYSKTCRLINSDIDLMTWSE